MAAATYATYAHGWWGTWGVGGQGPESTRIDPRCKELAHSDTGTGRGGGERGWCFQILFYDTCIGTCTQQSWWNRWNQFFFFDIPKGNKNRTIEIRGHSIYTARCWDKRMVGSCWIISGASRRQRPGAYLWSLWISGDRCSEVKFVFFGGMPH